MITAAVLNLSPFSGGAHCSHRLKAVSSGPSLPVLACFLVAFCGAMAIAWSRKSMSTARFWRAMFSRASSTATRLDLRAADAGILRFELDARLSLVFLLRWDTAAIAADFAGVVPGPDPAGRLHIRFRGAFHLPPEPYTAAVLLLPSGTLAGSACWVGLLSDGADGDSR